MHTPEETFLCIHSLFSQSIGEAYNLHLPTPRRFNEINGCVFRFFSSKDGDVISHVYQYMDKIP